jgi:hypothetical protein
MGETCHDGSVIISLYELGMHACRAGDWRGRCRVGRCGCKTKKFRHVPHPELMQRDKQLESVFVHEQRPALIEGQRAYLACAGSNFHIPSAFASFLPITPFFILSFNAFRLAPLSRPSLLALLSRGGFSSATCFPRTRASYVAFARRFEVCCESWERTYEGVKGTVVEVPAMG